MNLKTAMNAINREGMLLVFPIKDDKETPSLWQNFFPKSPMKWAWDDGADQRVADLWHLREELSRRPEVAYLKWFKGRATFMSLKVFEAALTILRQTKGESSFENRQSQLIFSELIEDSPQSIRTLKVAVDLIGREHEATFQKGLKELWNRLLIVGHGEIDDGAFPSLAIGATKWMFEDQWEHSLIEDVSKAQEKLLDAMPAQSPFLKYFDRVRRKLQK